MAEQTKSRKREYVEGLEARKNFETTMTKLFRAPKPAKPKRQPKEKAASEEKSN
jgi:hypothetical protein